MSEIYEEQLGRVRMMSEGSDTWDLSDNDIAALNAVLTKIAEPERQLAEAKEDAARLDGVLKKVRELIGRTASIILLPGRKTLNNADVSATVVNDARKACEAIDAARKETK